MQFYGERLARAEAEDAYAAMVVARASVRDLFTEELGQGAYALEFRLRGDLLLEARRRLEHANREVVFLDAIRTD